MLISNKLETLISKAIDRAYTAGINADKWDSPMPWYLRQNGMPACECQKIIKEVFYDYKED